MRTAAIDGGRRFTRYSHGNCKNPCRGEEEPGQEGSIDCLGEAGALKPIKEGFTKASLIVHLAQTSATDPRAAKAVKGALESTLLASINKKGLGEFTLPELLKVTALAVHAKKKRIGKDPFTGVEREFAAKPATTKTKVRPLKKLKDAAL